MCVNVKESLQILSEIGYNYDESLTRFEQLCKLYGIDGALAQVQEMEKDFYLRDFKYSIFQSTNGRWQVFIPLPDGTRKHITAKDKKNLENKIAQFIKSNAAVQCVFTTCLNDIIEDFISFKERDASPATAHKLQWAYNRYLKDSKISTCDIQDINVIQLKEFCLEKIDEFKLTDRGYKELKSLLNALFGYAVDLGIIQINTAQQMSRINSRKLNKVAINPETQVYSQQEELKLYTTAYQRYLRTGNTSYLGIILSGCLGLRIGELAALKTSDFDLDNGVVNIRRQEIRSWKTDDDGKYLKDGYQIVDYLKTDESERSLPISDAVYNVFSLIVEHNSKFIGNNEFLFVDNNGEKRHTSGMSSALKKTNKEAGLVHRSNHKLRKTLLSELETALGFTKTREFAGHSHNSVVLERNYLYPTSPLTSDTGKIDNILSSRIPAAML